MTFITKCCQTTRDLREYDDTEQLITPPEVTHDMLQHRAGTRATPMHAVGVLAIHINLTPRQRIDACITPRPNLPCHYNIPVLIMDYFRFMVTCVTIRRYGSRDEGCDQATICASRYAPWLCLVPKKC